MRPGSTIVAGLDIRPRLGVVTWTAEVTSGHDPPVHWRGSTFNGSILSTATIRALPGTASIPRGDRLALLETVLANIDGNASQIDLVDALAGEVGRSFASRVSRGAIRARRRRAAPAVSGLPPVVVAAGGLHVFQRGAPRSPGRGGAPRRAGVARGSARRTGARGAGGRWASVAAAVADRQPPRGALRRPGGGRGVRCGSRHLRPTAAGGDGAAPADGPHPAPGAGHIRRGGRPWRSHQPRRSGGRAGGELRRREVDPHRLRLEAGWVVGGDDGAVVAPALHPPPSRPTRRYG